MPLTCETKMPVNAPPVMNCHNNNGNYQPPSCGLKHKSVPPDVARLMQLEEGVRQGPEKKKPPIPPRHLKKSKEHCSVDMNGLETNVWCRRALVGHFQHICAQMQNILWQQKRSFFFFFTLHSSLPHYCSWTAAGGSPTWTAAWREHKLQPNLWHRLQRKLR